MLINNQNNKDITAFTTCINYSDIFGQVIESWLNMKFNKIIVVTDKNDLKTIDLCQKHHLEIIKINYTKPFIWGIYRNTAINHVKTEWVLGLDCDTYIPFKKIINVSNLNPKHIYGLPHQMVDQQQLTNIRLGIKQRIKGRYFKPCMGPFQLYNLDHNKQRYKTQSTVIGRKGADYHFAKTFQKREMLFNEVLYCLNLGERNGRVSPEIKTNKSMNLLISYQNIIKNAKKFNT